MTMHHDIEILGLFIAPGHSFYRQPGGQPADYPMMAHEAVNCVAGRGLEGDRFFDYRSDFKGQVTFFSAEVLEAVKTHTAAVDCPPWATRRNVLVSGIDLNRLIGVQFRIGEVVFEGTEECAPCAWMDFAIGPGAQAFLAGRGGLRARITASGALSAGPARLNVLTLE